MMTTRAEIPDHAISLLYTTARPHLIDQVVRRWLDEPAEWVEMIVVTDDPVDGVPADPAVRYVHNPGRRDCVTGWNLAARHATGNILIQISDDLFPPPGWHETIRRAIRRVGQVRQDVVLNLLDERRATNAVFHPILTRAAYDTASYLYPPDFESMYCDYWFHEFHSKNSNYHSSSRIFWHHRHRMTHAVAIDDVMRRHESHARFERGKAIFLKYKEEHGLKGTID